MLNPFCLRQVACLPGRSHFFNRRVSYVNFSKNIYRGAVEISLWLIPILFIVIGYQIGNNLPGNFQSLGAMLGLAVGILTDIHVGGFIATILKIDENLELLKDNSFKTSSGTSPMQLGSFTDSRDGKTYKTVKIGSQTWMAENLNYEAEGSKCYDNKPENCEKYGRLYNWNTAMKSCPSGWHLPNGDEWQKLVDIAGGDKVAGVILKANSGWKEDGNGTDKFGFRLCRAATVARMAVSTMSATAASGGVPASTRITATVPISG